MVFEFNDGTLWTHVLQALNNNADCGDLTASILGATATGHFGYYGGKAYVRGGPKHFVGPISGGMYNEGAGATSPISTATSSKDGSTTRPPSGQWTAR